MTSRSNQRPFWSSLDKRSRVLALERLEDRNAPDSLVNPIAPIVGLSSVGLLADPMGVDHGGFASSADSTGGLTPRFSTGVASFG